MSALSQAIRDLLPAGSILAHWSVGDLSALNDGDPVNSWTDAENGIVATPTNDPPIYRADYGAKGFPAVDFDLGGAASRGLLASSALLANKKITVLAVCYEATGVTVANASTPWAYGDGTTNLYRLRTGSVRGQYAHQYQNENSSITANIDDNADDIHCLATTFTSSLIGGPHRNKLIGRIGATGLNSQLTNTSPLTTQQFWIGKRPVDTVQGYPGALYEILVVDAELCPFYEFGAAQNIVMTDYGLEVFDPAPSQTTPDYPAVSDVRDGVEFDSGNLIGTVVIPETKDVRDQINYDAPTQQQTGRLELPAGTDVRLGISYGASGTEFLGAVNVPVENNVRENVAVDVSGTGNLVVPADTDVRAGTAFDISTIGLLDLPQVSDVRAGTAFDSLTKIGTLDLPAVSDVRLAVVFDNLSQTGRVELPVESDVRQGVEYDDTAAPRTGTLDPGGAADYPAVSDVRFGVIFDSGNLTGTCVVPVAADVRFGTAVDVSATGLLDLPAVSDVRLGVNFDNLTQTGRVELPGAGDVRLAVDFDDTAAPTTGRVELPIESDVRLGTEYDDTAAPRTGTLDPGAGEADYPLVSDVRLGIEYAQGGLVGRVELPIESDVRAGVQYDDTAAPRTGTLDVQTVIAQPDESSRRTIVRGDDVTLVWSNPGTWPDLAGATIKLGLVGDRGTLDDLAGSVNAEGDVEVRLDRTTTADLQNVYRYDVQATLAGGDVRTLDGAYGQLVALPTYTDQPDDIPTGRGWV